MTSSISTQSGSTVTSTETLRLPEPRLSQCPEGHGRRLMTRGRAQDLHEDDQGDHEGRRSRGAGEVDEAAAEHRPEQSAERAAQERKSSTSPASRAAVEVLIGRVALIASSHRRSSTSSSRPMLKPGQQPEPTTTSAAATADRHEGEDLPLLAAEEVGVADQGQVDRVEHQLDAHEDSSRLRRISTPGAPRLKRRSGGQQDPGKIAGEHRVAPPPPRPGARGGQGAGGSALSIRSALPALRDPRVPAESRCECGG